MIPEQLKMNIKLDTEIFGFPVHVNYKFFYPEIKLKIDTDPLVGHIEFFSKSKIISNTGYKSHFFYIEMLNDCSFQSIEELVVKVGENLAVQNGYQPPKIGEGHQMRLF